MVCGTGSLEYRSGLKRNSRATVLCGLHRPSLGPFWQRGDGAFDLVWMLGRRSNFIISGPIEDRIKASRVGSSLNLAPRHPLACNGRAIATTGVLHFVCSGLSQPMSALVSEIGGAMHQMHRDPKCEEHFLGDTAANPRTRTCLYLSTNLFFQPMGLAHLHVSSRLDVVVRLTTSRGSSGAPEREGKSK